MYAIIETGGKQYKVQEGDVIYIEKLGLNEGDAVEFTSVKAVCTNEGFKVGAPNVEGAVVAGTVLANGKGKKIYVMKYKSKKNEKKKIGHRQPYTKVQVLSIKG